MQISSLLAFASIKGGIYKGCKDVYFVRAVGVSKDYLAEITTTDKILSQKMLAGQGKYLRVDKFPSLCDFDEISYYTKVYSDWINSDKKTCVLNSCFKNNNFPEILSDQLNKTRELYLATTKNANPTIEKNFFIKLLFWLEKKCEAFLTNWGKKLTYKFIFAGVVKKQEYLFLYLLSLLGIDVMILLPQGDIEIEKDLLDVSHKLILGNPAKVAIPDYDIKRYENPAETSRLHEREHELVTISQSSSNGSNSPAIIRDNSPISNSRSQNSTNNQPPNVEFQFEELALLASSIVMLTLHNENDEIIGSGSGIMVAQNGYIITNNHVASGCRYFSVKIEDDDKLYTTDEIIKYNPLIDLALIRIDRKLNPLPFYKGHKKLVRGQRVVAIGSPMGFFNTVSNGIISGFRCFDGVDMIQFTAPTSPGSSGGALLNMYGEVIGISTSGMDKGQNINLAIGFESINCFIQGFIK